MKNKISKKTKQSIGFAIAILCLEGLKLEKPDDKAKIIKHIDNLKTLLESEDE